MSESAPTVSVVIPTYNHRDTIVETLDSVFAQTFRDFEIVVINDGSPDDTADVLRPYIRDGRIRYFEQANAGQGAARNRGMRESRGEFIAYLDDDDLWVPDKLEWQVAAFRGNPELTMVYGDRARFRQPGVFLPRGDEKRPSGNAYDEFRLRNWIDSPGQTLIRRSVLLEAGGFDNDIWGADDWDLYIRLARRGPFHYEPRVCLHYRLHASNASRSAARHARNHLKVMRKHYGLNAALYIRNLRKASPYFTPNLLDSGDELARAQMRSEALRAYRYVLIFRPDCIVRRSWWRRVWKVWRIRSQ